MAGPSSSSSLLLSLGLSDTNVYEPEMSFWCAVCGGDSDGAAHHALPPLDDHVRPRPYLTQSVDSFSRVNSHTNASTYPLYY